MRRLRERRAAGLQPVPDAEPRDPDELLGPAVEETLAALDLGGQDAAVAELARRYAKVIDEAQDPVWAIRWIGPLLLRVLEELRATPASRKTAARQPERRGPNRITALREAHLAATAKQRRS